MNQDQITRIEKIKAVLDAATKEGAVVQENGYGWATVGAPLWNFADFNYRVLLPSQPTKQGITAKDWNGHPVVWIKGKSDTIHSLILVIREDSFSYQTNGGLIIERFDTASPRWDYSFDRKDWHPFTKEVPGEMVVVANTE